MLTELDAEALPMLARMIRSDARRLVVRSQALREAILDLAEKSPAPKPAFGFQRVVQAAAGWARA